MYLPKRADTYLCKEEKKKEREKTKQTKINKQ